MEYSGSGDLSDAKHSKDNSASTSQSSESLGQKKLKPFEKIDIERKTNREALSPIQKSGSKGENEMVGRHKAVTGSQKARNGSSSSKNTPDQPGAASTPKRVDKVRNGFITKRKYADKSIQTLNPDLELITGDEPPLIYWKELAETRRLALQEALEENENLHVRVEDLEKENRLLEEMVDEAKRLTDIISNISDDDIDESGFIQGSEEDTGYEQDLSSSFGTT